MPTALPADRLRPATRRSQSRLGGGVLCGQAAVGRGRKQPYFITIGGDQPFAFAGLWEAWTSPEGGRVESCTIVVTSANDQLRPIHDRMPVILEPEVFDHWLDTTAPLNQAKTLLLALYAGEMTSYPVSHLVNTADNDEPACVQPVAPATTPAGRCRTPS